MNTEKRSDFMSANHLCAEALWSLKKAKAAFVIRNPHDETIQGPNLDVTEDEAFAATDAYAADSEVKSPYGTEVHYCDNNMRGDGKKRFPVNCERVKAAWSYSHHKSIMDKYSPEQLSRLHSCIAAAYKKCHGEEPPSAQ